MNERPPVSCESTSVTLLEVCAGTKDTNRVTGYAQLYEHPNDRKEIFQQGSAAKTIQERVSKGRVKVNDGHSWYGHHTHGVVVDAKEDSKGLWFDAKWSQAPAAQEIRTKMLEGILDEVSIEWRSIRESYERVGDAYFRMVQEWSWVGLAVVPYSSQGVAAITSVRSAVPYNDLPLAPMETPWVPADAATRVAAWAAGNMAKLRRAYLWDSGEGPDGLEHLVCDVANDRLVVVPQAMIRAAGGLLDVEGHPDQVAQARAAVDRYLDRMRTELRAPADLKAPWAYTGADHLLYEIRTTSQVDANRLTEATDLAKRLLVALPVEARATVIEAVQQDAGPGATDATPPTSESADSGEAQTRESAQVARELQELELELQLLTGG